MYHTPGFVVGAGLLNSGPQAYTASTLPLKQFLLRYCLSFVVLLIEARTLYMLNMHSTIELYISGLAFCFLFFSFLFCS